jgi:hypothetical protein
MIWDEYNRIQRLEYNRVLHQRKPFLAYKIQKLCRVLLFIVIICQRVIEPLMYHI